MNAYEKVLDEFGFEFQISFAERFGISLSSNVPPAEEDGGIDGLTETALAQMHMDIEAEVKELMMTHFFGSIWRFVMLLAPTGDPPPSTVVIICTLAIPSSFMWVTIHNRP